MLKTSLAQHSSVRKKQTETIQEAKQITQTVNCIRTQREMATELEGTNNNALALSIITGSFKTGLKSFS